MYMEFTLFKESMVMGGGINKFRVVGDDKSAICNLGLEAIGSEFIYEDSLGSFGIFHE